MNKQLQIILAFGLLLVSILTYSQQDAQYTQYMYNTISVNPAYAGSRGVMSINGLHRSQWVGLEGAPRTQTVSLHTPIGDNNKVGLGLSVVNDEVGPVNESYIDANFSYTIRTSESGKLAFGLKAGVHLLNIDLQSLSQFNQGDQFFANNIDNKTSPQVGIGLYYHTDKFYAGLSAPNVLETDHFDDSSLSSNSDGISFLAEERINYYLITGYVFHLNDQIKFKPALLSKLVLGAPLQVDVSANFLFYERLILGAAYRWSAALSAMAGFQISDSLMIGFAYDRETTELGNTLFNDGSYEVMLRFELFRKYNRMLTPRFF
ncbi:type IX secretion system membrane protein PorP/SprF [Aquimarina sp. ERC-38]|uniref:PorP/SprF family type IX secretion system membrane protein n=1 Tax=Aquimarina sp. ERC-38 TaxID=2949996 RepID=UPI002247384E|nr:type IX secretion system membrane protein PorP/SprF [Aquimarina sp. ERC-38]UZO79409.1 type IX secretion system membrane protein PorP/SprF [Aquimarina sp. ERC-38]